MGEHQLGLDQVCQETVPPPKAQQARKSACHQTTAMRVGQPTYARHIGNLDGWENLDNQTANSRNHGVGLVIQLTTCLLTVIQLTVMQLVIQLVIQLITCLLTASTFILCPSREVQSWLRQLNIHSNKLLPTGLFKTPGVHWQSQKNV